MPTGVAGKPEGPRVVSPPVVGTSATSPVRPRMSPQFFIQQQQQQSPQQQGESMWNSCFRLCMIGRDEKVHLVVLTWILNVKICQYRLILGDVGGNIVGI